MFSVVQTPTTISRSFDGWSLEITEAGVIAVCGDDRDPLQPEDISFTEYQWLKSQLQHLSPELYDDVGDLLDEAYLINDLFDPERKEEESRHVQDIRDTDLAHYHWSRI